MKKLFAFLLFFSLVSFGQDLVDFYSGAWRCVDQTGLPIFMIVEYPKDPGDFQVPLIALIYGDKHWEYAVYRFNGNMIEGDVYTLERSVETGDIKWGYIRCSIVEPKNIYCVVKGQYEFEKRIFCFKMFHH